MRTSVIWRMRPGKRPGPSSWMSDSCCCRANAHQCSEKAHAQPVGNLIDSAAEYRALCVFGLQTNRSCPAGQALFARKNRLIRKPRIASCPCIPSYPCHAPVSPARMKAWARITLPRSRSRPQGSNPRARRIARTASAWSWPCSSTSAPPGRSRRSASSAMGR